MEIDLEGGQKAMIEVEGEKAGTKDGKEMSD